MSFYVQDRTTCMIDKYSPNNTHDVNLVLDEDGVRDKFVQRKTFNLKQSVQVYIVHIKMNTSLICVGLLVSDITCNRRLSTPLPPNNNERLVFENLFVASGLYKNVISLLF